MDEAAHGGDQARAAKPVEDPGGHDRLLAPFLDAELLGPDDDRPPEELIEGDDHQHHGEHGPTHGVDAALFDGDGHVRADAGEAEVFVAELEGFGDHQKEPAAGHAHHAVPDEAHRGEGELDPFEALPPVEAVDRGDVLLIGGNGAERVVEAEGHVPGLAGEDHEDGGELEADVVAREEGVEGEQQAGQERRARGCFAGCRGAGSGRGRPSRPSPPSSRRRA